MCPVFFQTAKGKILLPLLLLPFWYLIYHYLQFFTNWFVFSALGMNKGEHLAKAIWFFVFEFPKVMLLLILIIFFVGIVRTYFTPERTRKALGGKKTFFGNILASLLGVVTPFCSCSAIPLFLGFVEAGVPLGVTFSFLIAAPLINEVAVVLLFGMFSWKVAAIYVGTGLFLAIVAGWVIGKLKLEKWIEPWVFDTKLGKNILDEENLHFSERIRFGYDAVREIVGKIWIYVAAGIAIGAAAHGYVPEDYLASLMGKAEWYSVPLSILIGIPLYSNAAGIVPIVAVLIEKGASLGTSLAFMMAVIGLSLPELIILRKVLKLPLILTFIAIVGVGILFIGYFFNWLF
jgi:uncharacterized protein